MIGKRTLGLGIGVATLAATLLQASPASAHVTPNTNGTTYTAGVTNVFLLRVPHSCADPDTTNSPGATSLTSKLVVDVPSTVTSVKPQFIPGWELSTVKSPTGAVTQITWEASSAAFALPDTSYMDFGIRAMLVGKAGDKIGLPTHQHCDYHENGTAATGLVDEWTGADTPTLTLVGAESGVNSPAQIADVKSKASKVDGVATELGSLQGTTRDQVNFLSAMINHLTQSHGGDAAASRGILGRINVAADLSSIHRGRNVDVLVNGRKLGSRALNSAGDLSTSFPGAGIPAGARVDIVLYGSTVASATL